MKKTGLILEIIVAVLCIIAVGLIIYALNVQPARLKCNDGVTIQIVDGIKKKTYTPALDTCKDKGVE